MIRTAIVAALAVLSAAIAIAQPASPASAPQALTEADITYASACGAPGVGRQYSAAKGRPKGLIHAREGAPGVRVGPAPNGYWTAGCQMPPPAKDCPSRAAPGWVGLAGHYCQPTQRTVPGRDVGREVQLVPGPSASNRGSHVLACHRMADGTAGWVVVSSYCERRPR